MSRACKSTPLKGFPFAGMPRFRGPGIPGPVRGRFIGGVALDGPAGLGGSFRFSELLDRVCGAMVCVQEKVGLLKGAALSKGFIQEREDPQQKMFGEASLFSFLMCMT